jgi:proteasome beta subunit
MAEEYKGTTTIGLICENGVVFASERRATMGSFIATRAARKIYQIDDFIAMTTAGAVGDAQTLVRWMTVEAKLYKMRRQESMTVGAITTLLSNILSASRYYPFFVQLLVGGLDKKGPALYSIDPLGGAIEEREIVATGSGSPIAYGVLEDRYRRNMSLDEGIDLAIRALAAAIKRDAASGNGIEVITITPEGYKVLAEEEIKKRMEKLHLTL